jgi:predicted dinucleotide-binding enzyme
MSEVQNIGIVGGGQVAQTIGNKMLTLGLAVMISSRDLDSDRDLGPRGKLPSVNQWASQHTAAGLKAFGGSFSQAAEFGEVVFNCTAGVGSVDALTAAGEHNLADKILVDLANPLDFSQGMPPTLAVCNTDSLGERIQAHFPQARVVKALNTVSAGVMVDPKLVTGAHDIFVAGNDVEAKEWVSHILLREWFGWERINDLGDITAARALEMYLPLWLQLFQMLQTPYFNIQVVR